MQQAESTLQSARLIAMGDEALMQGFALVGFETWPDAGREELDRLLGELIAGKEQALLLLQSRLMRSGSANLQRVMNEGGRLVVAEIPSLEAADGFHSSIEELLQGVMQPGGAS
jgi:vacuolar-type H+-ATPase subunit F/Vma7